MEALVVDYYIYLPELSQQARPIIIISPVAPVEGSRLVDLLYIFAGVVTTGYAYNNNLAYNPSHSLTSHVLCVMQIKKKVNEHRKKKIT